MRACQDLRYAASRRRQRFCSGSRAVYQERSRRSRESGFKSPLEPQRPPPSSRLHAAHTHAPLHGAYTQVHACTRAKHTCTRTTRARMHRGTCTRAHTHMRSHAHLAPLDPCLLSNQGWDERKRRKKEGMQRGVGRSQEKREASPGFSSKGLPSPVSPLLSC